MKSSLKTLITLAAMLMLIFSLCAVAEDTLQLPKDLKIIKANTFYGGTSIDKVVVPEGVTEIHSKAFANSSLKEITLPNSITFIADDAFEGCGQFTYACSEGSYAHSWGLTHGYILLNAPENIAVSVKKDKALSISWNPVKYAVGYYILSDGEIAGKTVGGNQCTYALENLASNKEYQISIQAYVDKYNGGEIPGKASDSVTCRTAPELTVTASVSNNTIIIGNPIDISVHAAGTYGSYTYRYTFKKGSETVFASGECTSTQYTYTPSSVGTYSIIVSVNDSLGRTSSYQINDINLIAPELIVDNAKADKSFAMVGESITILAESNRDSSTLTYYANVYCGDIKVDSIIGMGRLMFVPDTVGIYSFSLTITDEYGQASHIYLDSELTVVPYWKISGISVNTNSAAVGESITFTVAAQGDIKNVNLTYIIYRDSKEYRRLADTTKTEYTFTVNDEGQYYCVCTAADAFNNQISVQSEKVTVERKTVVNPVYSTATHSGTLDADELNGLSSKYVRITKDTITITWDKLSTDSYYDLRIRGSLSSIGRIMYDTNYKKNAYTIPASSLVQGCEYNVTIDRYDKSGKCIDDLEFEFVVIGGESLKLEESFKIIAPAKYAGVNYDDVVIQWKQMNYASTITVSLEYNCGAGKHNITSISVDPSASSYTIPKDLLYNKKIHKVKVLVKDNLGHSDSDSREFYVGCAGTEDLVDINPPILTSSYLWDLPARDQTPTYPVYEPIKISWEEMPAVEWFSLHLTNYKTKEELIFDKITTNHYTVQPTKLTSGALYKVEVYAHHTADCYEKSDIWELRAPYKENLLLDPPTVISPDLSMDKKDPTIFVLQDLVVSWEAVSAAKTYDVKLYCVDDDCVDYEVTGLTKLTTTIPKGDIFTNLLYYLSVSAYDANGNNTYQGYYLKMIPSTITKPVLVSPALSTDSDNVSICADKNMQLMWGTVEGAVEYRVQLHELSGSRWEILVDAENVKETTYTIPATELYNGGLFRIRIKAIDKYGNGQYSEMYYFQVGSSKFIELTLTDWTYDYTGGNKSFSIITSKNWTASVSDSWITIDKTSGKVSDRVSVTVKENTGDFPRSGSVTFTNAAGGRAVFSIVQAGNGSANAGALKITTPEQGDTLDYAKFRANWNYKVEHAYFTVNLLDVTTGKTVYSLQHILFYADIPQSALTYGHIYQLTVAAYNAQYKKISESSVVFKVESLNSGTNDDDDVIEEPDIPEGATEIIYTGIKDGATIVKDDFTVSWQNVIGADHYYVAMRDLTLYPDGTPEDNVKKIIDQKTDLLTTNIHAGQLVEGHSYRLWIAAHKNGVDSPISGKNIYFSVKAADDAPEITDTNIPTATLTVASNQITLGDSIALSGKVLANGGILNQIRVTIQDAQTGKFCDYAIYDTATIGSFGSYDSFDLTNVYPITTGIDTSIGTSGSGYARAGSENLYLDTAGNKFNIVVYGKNNGETEMRVLASIVIKVVSERNNESITLPQIFYFEPQKATGYKAQEYTFTMETTGNVTSVELYIDEYRMTPEINLELQNGYHFYELVTPIWEAGKRQCRVVVTSTTGETAEASCYVDVLDAEYKKLPTPELTNPVPYSDGEARGVINSPFTVSWKENNAYSNAEITVNIARNGTILFTQNVKSNSNSIFIPDTVLDNVGLYTISIVATRIGNETSDFFYMPLRAYVDEKAIIQELCPHNSGTTNINQSNEWMKPDNYDATVHYFKEYFDKACILCGLILEQRVPTTENYMAEKHSMLDNNYCSCGYCIGFSSIGDKKTMSKSYSVPVYRLPTKSSEKIGTLYSMEEVSVLYQIGNMSYVSYWSSAYNITRYGFVDSSCLDSGLTFNIWIKSTPQKLTGIIATEYGGGLLTSYHANLDKASQIFPITVKYENAFSGTIIGFNNSAGTGYQVGFDLNNAASGELVYCTANPISRSSNPISMKFSRNDSNVFVALESLCEMLGFDFYPDKAKCVNPTYEKSQVKKKLDEQRSDLLTATCFLYKEDISEVMLKVMDAGWIVSQPGYWVGRMFASGVVDGSTTYFSDLGGILFQGKEQMGEEIVEILVAQKLLELEDSYRSQQQELLGFLGELHNLYKSSDEVLSYFNKVENLYSLIKLSDHELDLLLSALLDEKYGAFGTFTSMSKEYQEIYSALVGKNSTSKLKPFFKQVRNIRSNALIGTMFGTLSKVVELGATMAEEEQLNLIYYKYKDVLVADLEVWAEVYKGKPLYVDIQEMIKKIKNLPAPSTTEWKIETFFSSHPGEWAFSLTAQCATTIFSKSIYAIPFVGKAMAIIDATSAVLNMLGYDLEKVVNGYMIIQASAKYYVDMAAYINNTVYTLNEDNVKTFIDRLRQCVRWESLLMQTLKDIIMGLQSSNVPTQVPLYVLTEEMISYVNTTSIDTISDIVEEYIDLLEVYYSLK